MRIVPAGRRRSAVPAPGRRWPPTRRAASVLSLGTLAPLTASQGALRTGRRRQVEALEGLAQVERDEQVLVAVAAPHREERPWACRICNAPWRSAGEARRSRNRRRVRANVEWGRRPAGRRPARGERSSTGSQGMAVVKPAGALGRRHRVRQPLATFAPAASARCRTGPRPLVEGAATTARAPVPRPWYRNRCRLELASSTRHCRMRRASPCAAQRVLPAARRGWTSPTRSRGGPSPSFHGCSHPASVAASGASPSITNLSRRCAAGARRRCTRSSAPGCRPSRSRPPSSLS